MILRSFAAVAAVVIGFAGSASAFETGQKSYTDPPAGSRAAVTDPDEALQERFSGTQNLFGSQYDSTVGPQSFGPTGHDDMPRFPGLDNHLTVRDNATLLQNGYMPTYGQPNRW